MGGGAASFRLLPGYVPHTGEMQDAGVQERAGREEETFKDGVWGDEY